MKDSEIREIYNNNLNTWAEQVNKVYSNVEKVMQEAYSNVTDAVGQAEYIGFQQGFSRAYKLFDECRRNL